MGSFCPATAERIGGDRALVAELDALARGQGLRVVHAQRAWASITFEGTHHTITWTFDGYSAVEAGLAMADALPEHEFSIPGLLVAEAVVVSSYHRTGPEPHLELKFEVLVLKDS